MGGRPYSRLGEDASENLTSSLTRSRRRGRPLDFPRKARLGSQATKRLPIGLPSIAISQYVRKLSPIRSRKEFVAPRPNLPRLTSRSRSNLSRRRVRNNPRAIPPILQQCRRPLSKVLLVGKFRGGDINNRKDTPICKDFFWNGFRKTNVGIVLPQIAGTIRIGNVARFIP